MKFKNLLLVMALTVLSSTATFAQFSAGLELGLPMGTFGDTNGLGFGVSGRYEAAINDNLSWNATLGYISYTGKDYSIPGFGVIPGVSFAMIPITGGIKYYFTEIDNGFYGSADLGIWLASGSGSSGSEFGISPGLGYRVGSFDIGARYNIVGNVSTLGFRFGYVFGAK